MKDDTTHQISKRFLRDPSLLVLVVLVITVLPLAFARQLSASKKFASQRSVLHASEPLGSEGFRELDWLEQKVTASDGAANDSLGWSIALDGNTALAGAPNATVNGHSSQGNCVSSLSLATLMGSGKDQDRAFRNLKFFVRSIPSGIRLELNQPTNNAKSTYV
jgi:FG-GAP repeat